MTSIDEVQVYRILQNLSALELSFMEYSVHSRDFVKYSTYLAYMDNLIIKKHNLWKFYFPEPLLDAKNIPSIHIPNVVYSTQQFADDVNFTICKLFNFPMGPLHQCDYYSFLYNYEGLAHVTIGKNIHDLNPGDFFIIPPMVPYALDIEHESICLSINLKESYINSDYTNLFHDNQQLINYISGFISTRDTSGFISIHTDNNSKLQSLMLQIFVEYINKDKYYQSAMRGLLYLFFTQMFRGKATTYQTTISNTKVQKNYQAILEYIQTNYQTTDLDDTAKHLMFSKQYICRIIKDATGYTYSKLLLAEKLKVASNLLLTSQSSLEEISEMCGFSTASYFSRVFKDTYGMSPSHYRKATEK